MLTRNGTEISLTVDAFVPLGWLSDESVRVAGQEDLRQDIPVPLELEVTGTTVGDLRSTWNSRVKSWGY